MDASVAALLSSERARLAKLMPLTAASLNKAEERSVAPLADLVREMPARSRHRAPLVKSFKHMPSSWAAKTFGVSSSYKYNLFLRVTQCSPFICSFFQAESGCNKGGLPQVRLDRGKCGPARKA